MLSTATGKPAEVKVQSSRLCPLLFVVSLSHVIVITFEITDEDAEAPCVMVMGDLTPTTDDDAGFAEQFGPDIYEKQVVIDLNDVSFISSAGINWLLIVNRSFKRAGGRCVICCVPPRVMKAFRLMAIDRALTLADDRDHARQLLKDA